jgi:hypothetical protein
VTRVSYDFRIRLTGSAPGEPRPVALSARVSKLVADALRRDGFAIEENALPNSVGVEVADMRFHEEEEGE